MKLLVCATITQRKLLFVMSSSYFSLSPTFQHMQPPLHLNNTSNHLNQPYQRAYTLKVIKKKKISKQKSGMLISKQYQQVCLVHDTKKFHSNRIILRFPNTHKGKICKHSYHIYSKFRLNLLVYPLILLIQKKKKKTVSHLLCFLASFQKKNVVI